MTMPNVLYNGPGNWPDADKLMANFNYLESVGSGYTSFRNKIINGDMAIDQRNAGASVTNTTGNLYPVDRWRIYGSVASKFSAQQGYSITPPPGYANHLGILSLSAYSVGNSDSFTITQAIEGLRMVDFAFGTGSARALTLSFWVKTNMSGGTVFGGAVQNAATDRSFPFSFTVNNSSSWEYKTISITADTSGTWPTNNTASMFLRFSLGMGNSLSGTAGAWVAGDYRSVTGATSVVGTNGATFFITGVQLEAGTIATSYEFIPIHLQLPICQRYFEKSIPVTTKPGSAYAGQLFIGTAGGTSMGGWIGTFKYSIDKRITPTTNVYDNIGNSGKITTWTGGLTTDNVTPTNAAWGAGEKCHTIYHTGSVAGIQWNATADAEI